MFRSIVVLLIITNLVQSQNPKSCNKNSQRKDCARSCAELEKTVNVSGVYYIFPESIYVNTSVQVYCELSSDHKAGWTVIQRRGQYRQTTVDFFFRDWEDYKEGFGDRKKEFWIGNKYLWGLTIQEEVLLRIELTDWDGNYEYGETSMFRILDMNDYPFFYYGFRGNLSNALPRNGIKFSTYDRDQDNSVYNCAQKYKSGWWFNNCHNSNLNGMNLKGRHRTEGDGINWNGFRGIYYSLKTSVMKIRPTNYTMMP